MSDCIVSLKTGLLDPPMSRWIVCTGSFRLLLDGFACATREKADTESVQNEGCSAALFALLCVSGTLGFSNLLKSSPPWTSRRSWLKSVSC
jgi:hypothetical protein